MAFSNALRRLRKEQNLKQEELAKRVGLAKATISSYETGKSYPDERVFRLLLNVLQVDANTLFDWDEYVASYPMQSGSAYDVSSAFNRAPDYVQRAIMGMLEPYMTDVAAEIVPILRERNADDAILDLADTVSEVIHKKPTTKVG